MYAKLCHHLSIINSSIVSCQSLFYYFMCMGVSPVYNPKYSRVLLQNNPFQLTVGSLIEPCSLQASECLHQLCQVPVEVSRRCQITCERSCRWMKTTLWLLRIKPRASEEQSVLLTDKPSHFSYTLIKIKVFLIEILIHLRWPPES